VVLESSRTVTVVPASLNEDEEEAKVTLLKAYFISLPHDTVLWTSVFIQELFRLRVSFCLQVMAKFSNASASSFA
jgi:hypothetical protein